MNKTDLPQADTDEFDRLTNAFPHSISLSAKTGDTEALTRLITALFADGALTVGQDAILSDARQFGALSRAKGLLISAADAIRQGMTAEVACSDAELALAALSEADGRAVSEEVVNSIFSHFCVGK